MNKNRRLALLVLLTWVLAAFLAWLTLSPPPPLVGGKTPSLSLSEDGWRLARPDLAEALLQLETLPLWGVNRDARPLPSKEEKEQQAKPIVWRIFAAVSRRDERYVLITVDQAADLNAPNANNAPNKTTRVVQTVHEGEELPNGGKLLKVDPKSIVYLDAEGKQHADTLNF
jgi:hypothetical protein